MTTLLNVVATIGSFYILSLVPNNTPDITGVSLLCVITIWRIWT